LFDSFLFLPFVSSFEYASLSFQITCLLWKDLDGSIKVPLMLFPEASNAFYANPVVLTHASVAVPIFFVSCIDAPFAR